MQKYFEGSVLNDDEIYLLKYKVKADQIHTSQENLNVNHSNESLSGVVLPEIRNRLRFDPSGSQIGESSYIAETNLVLREENDESTFGQTKGPFRSTQSNMNSVSFLGSQISKKDFLVNER